MRRYSKYNSKKTVIDGIEFDSRFEAQRWCELRMLEKGGAIHNLRRQVVYELQPGFKKNGVSFRPIRYIADFVYEENGQTVVEDTKGCLTDEYRLKKKLFEYRYHDLHIKEVRRK